MEWGSIAPVLFAVALFLLVGTLFERKLEETMRILSKFELASVRKI